MIQDSVFIKEPNKYSTTTLGSLSNGAYSLRVALAKAMTIDIPNSSNYYPINTVGAPRLKLSPICLPLN